MGEKASFTMFPMLQNKRLIGPDPFSRYRDLHRWKILPAPSFQLDLKKPCVANDPRSRGTDRENKKEEEEGEEKEKESYNI